VFSRSYSYHGFRSSIWSSTSIFGNQLVNVNVANVFRVAKVKRTARSSTVIPLYVLNKKNCNACWKLNFSTSLITYQSLKANQGYSIDWDFTNFTIFLIHWAVQWHYIDKLSSDTVSNHTFITINHQALFIYNRTKITAWFPVLPLKNVLPHA